MRTFYQAAKYQELLQSIGSDKPIKMDNSSLSEGSAIFIKPDNKKCPFCAEDIKYEAIVCRYCGRDLPAVEKKLNIFKGDSRYDRKQIAKKQVKRIDEIHHEITSLVSVTFFL